MKNDFEKMLDAFGQQSTQAPVEIPYAPQATMPDSLAQLANEEMPAAPVAAPPMSESNSSESRLKTSISGTIPQSDKAEGSMTAEERLEKMMRDLNDERKKQTEDAQSRKFKADIFKIIGDNIGGIVGGAQAMNTKAAVTPVKTQGYDVGDLVGQVEKKFSGDREALMDQYKQLLSARDRSEQRKFQQDSLQVQREGNAIKQQIADRKAGASLTPGQEALDKDFGKKYSDWTSNGRSSVDANIKKLEEVYAELDALPKDEKTDRRPVAGKLWDAFQGEEQIQRREKVRSSAQEALRATLGAQFTEKEGEAIMNRAYDPTLSPQANMARMKAVIEERKQARNEKNRQAAEFETRGTLSKYNAQPSTISAQPNTDAKVDSFMKKNNITDRNEAIKILKDAGKI